VGIASDPDGLDRGWRPWWPASVTGDVAFDDVVVREIRA
jgi:hypothetical protein